MLRASLCLAVVAASLAAVPRRITTLNAEIPNDILPLHNLSPFHSEHELMRMEKTELVDLLLSVTGGDRSSALRNQKPSSNSAGWPFIWPHPANYTNGTGTIEIDGANFAIHTSKSSDDLTAAFARYKMQMFPHRSSASSKNAVASMQVTVDDPSTEIQLETDESYELRITSDGTINLKAKTQVGVYHGLETLSQLISYDYDSTSYVISACPWVITDAPRFKHREILIDSGRHFLPVPTIKNVIDSMTYAKLNVVHWHLVDSQSFAFDSPSYPDLSRKGAFSSRERYSVEDVEDVVEYARARGVRVMVEIDNPGHAASWCAGYPEICPDPSCTQPLNPATNATFDLMAGLFKDVTGGSRGSGLFFDNFMHLGGDEVNTDCWTKSQKISAWMKEQNYTTDDAYYYFVGRAQDIARGMGRDVVGWEEIWKHFGTKLDKSTIIQQWLPGSTVAKDCVANGYRVIWSTDGVWYLDGLSVTWDTMYVQEPCKDIDDDLCAKYVIGGGGEQWGETVDTSDIQQTIWPRAGAIAERLWSPRSVNDTDAAKPRFANFRCMLNRRGVAAAPISNAQARSAPSGPGGCYDQ